MFFETLCLVFLVGHRIPADKCKPKYQSRLPDSTWLRNHSYLDSTQNFKDQKPAACSTILITVVNILVHSSHVFAVASNIALVSSGYYENG